MVGNIHLKLVLAVYLAHGDVFRAQEHLQTPSELQDRALGSWPCAHCFNDPGYLSMPGSIDDLITKCESCAKPCSELRYSYQMAVGTLESDYSVICGC